MTTRRKALLAAGALLACAVLALGLLIVFVRTVAFREYREREAALRPLLQRHATVSQVAEALRVEFVDYSVGSTNRWVIEQRISDPQIKQRASRYPGLFFSTTADWMTWVFFDAEGHMQDYYLCVQ